VSFSAQIPQSRERFLEEKLDRLERTLELVLEASKNKGKGKGRGKKSTPRTCEPPGDGLLSRIRSSFSNRGRDTHNTQEEDRASTSSAESYRNQASTSSADLPPPYSPREENQFQDATEGKVFIKKVDILLNGAPLGNCVLLMTNGFSAH